MIAVSIDVEEEGLFSGRYPREAEGVSNVAALRRLSFVTSEFGIPLTLLADYPVLVSPACCEHLAWLHQDHGAEIGTHLHHWNTPPFAGGDDGPPALAQDIDAGLLQEKLLTLTEAVRNRFGIKPATFRMGRFDCSPAVRTSIADLGYAVDSSVVPFRFAPGTADFLFPPADPFILPLAQRDLLEVPVTMVPVSLTLAKAAARIIDRLPVQAAGQALGFFRRLAVCGPHPAWFPLLSMMNAAMLHIHRGGRVLNIFLHSTEIVPGMSPASADIHQAEAVLGRLRTFLAWLHKRYRVQGITLSGLHGTGSGKSGSLRQACRR